MFTSAPGSNPNTIVAEDFNKDGILDLAVSTDIVSSERGVTVFIGGGIKMTDPNETLLFEPVRFFTGASTAIAESLVTGDFNNDTNPDIAVVNTTGSDLLAVLLGDGTGNFGTPIIPELPEITPRILATGDFDSDGNLDIAATSFGGTAILRGDGTGNFTVANIVNSEESNDGDITVADFNNDGKLDFATVDSFFSEITTLLCYSGAMIAVPSI